MSLDMLGAVNFSRLLKKGDKGDDVRAVQQALSGNLGFSTKVDGDFGPNTDSAVRAFQKARGLKVDGLVGPETLAALGLAAPANMAQTMDDLRKNLEEGKKSVSSIVKNSKGQPIDPYSGKVLDTYSGKWAGRAATAGTAGLGTCGADGEPLAFLAVLLVFLALWLVWRIVRLVLLRDPRCDETIGGTLVGNGQASTTSTGEDRR